MRTSTVGIIAGASALLALSVHATQYTLSKGPSTLADWKSSEFYTGAAPAAGTKADEIILPAGMKATVDDASVEFVSGFKRIKPGKNSELVVDIAGDATLGCGYTAYSGSGDSVYLGKLIKQGTGNLSLTSVTNFGANDYCCDTLRVTGGRLTMPGTTDADGVSVRHFYYGNLEVIDPAIAELGTAANQDWPHSARNWFLTVTGDGTITNGVGSKSSENCFFHIKGAQKEPAVFSGKMVGLIRNYHCGNQYFTGTNSTQSGSFRAYLNQGNPNSGIVGIRKIGYDTSDPSSIGYSSGLTCSSYGGLFRYLGEGETTKKNIVVYEGDENAANNKAGIFDAGAVGNIVFQGKFVAEGSGKLQRLHLTGSNSIPCRVEGTAPVNANSLLYITKKGTGEWQFVGNADRSGVAGWAVAEGTLTFDSLYEKGKSCALGTCDRFLQDQYGNLADMTDVPYCFKIGGTGTEGTFKYIGAESLWCTTRPMALAGDGRLVNAGTGVRYHFHSGITSIATGTHTLTLAGDTTEESVISEVRDGTAGAVGIAKEGSGTWVISGTNAFTGPIDVKEGKLVLRGRSGKFTWFKWTIRDTRHADCKAITGVTSTGVQIGEFGLFDASNARVNMNLPFGDASYGNETRRYKTAEYRKMAAGTVAYNYENVPYFELRDINRDLPMGFDGSAGTFWGIKVYDPTTVGEGKTKVEIEPTPSDPSTWLPVIMRLEAGVNAVSSYDLTSPGAGYGYGNKCGEGVLPKSWTLEGSVDGVHWYVVHEIDNAPWPNDPGKSYPWLKGGQEANGKDTSTHTGGWAINGSTNVDVVAYANAVSVAAGATLEAEGNVRLTNLRVDSAGAGTIRGFLLGGEGTIEVGKLNTTTTLPGTYDLAEGELEKVANWSVSCNGKIKKSWTAAVRDGKITIYKPGLLYIIK